MGYFKEAYHDVRFNFNHFVVDYKRKYYSLNQNPRVLRARVSNQPFTSLRTYEYYPPLPGTNEEESEESFDDENKENVPEHWLSSTNMDLFPSFDACFDHTENGPPPRRILSEADIDQVGDDLLESFSLDMKVGSNSSHGRNFEMVHSDTESGHNIHTDSGMQYVGPFHLVYPTPLSTEVKKGHRLSRIIRSFSDAATRCGQNDASNASSLSLENMEQQEKSDEQVGRKPPPTVDQPSNKIWKMVLNDASLSAARVSTGNSTSPVVTNQCIKADFTDARAVPPKQGDIFAQHLEQAKLKYSPKSSIS
ncbi:hypothetical protein KGF57_004237 [Candida theae]|uniref:Uncharacterized protein n=1 Tax=Candida theae TaxID=1198502 RepID=A0AAD5FWZ9_9ASCO|nr:uncharacterized protein KGF57_004237 [Candida theae]KAI5950689.1 hypothetical protein KGF57_004237 [Candida theae]